jgi:hypothetical protein
MFWNTKERKKSVRRRANLVGTSERCGWVPSKVSFTPTYSDSTAKAPVQTQSTGLYPISIYVPRGTCYGVSTEPSS